MKLIYIIKKYANLYSLLRTQILLLLLLIPTIVFADDIDRQLFAAINQSNLSAVEHALQSQVNPVVRNSAALISRQTPLSLAVSLGDSVDVVHQT